MSLRNSPLFSPIRVGNLELPGRLFKSATTKGRCSEGCFVTDELIEYYEQIEKI
jgi:2,4-dienoyl-CoA reductase-like NADH-dependent reductase (Old Yellow Enzyme family)